MEAVCCADYMPMCCRKVVSADSLPPLALNSRFSFWIYFHRLFHISMMSRQWRFKMRIFLHLDGLLSWAVEFHLLKVADYEALVVHFHPVSGLELDLVARGYLRCIPWKNFIDSGSLSPLSPNLWNIYNIGI